MTERAENFLTDRDRTNPGETIVFADVYRVLDHEARKHELPVVDGQLYERATRTAVEILGWGVTEPPGERGS